MAQESHCRRLAGHATRECFAREPTASDTPATRTSWTWAAAPVGSRPLGSATRLPAPEYLAGRGVFVPAASGVPHSSTADAVTPRRADHRHRPSGTVDLSLSFALLLRYNISMHLNVSHLAPRFRGRWIALADDEETVLGSGKTAEEAFTKAQKTRPETLIITHLPDDDEIPNDDLIAAMREAEEEDRQGKLKFYSTVEDFMASLD